MSISSIFNIIAAPICEEFYPVIKADETCDSIVAANQMKLVTLATLNPDLKCDKPLEIGHMLCLNLLVSELL